MPGGRQVFYSDRGNASLAWSVSVFAFAIGVQLSQHRMNRKPLTKASLRPPSPRRSIAPRCAKKYGGQTNDARHGVSRVAFATLSRFEQGRGNRRNAWEGAEGRAFLLCKFAFDLVSEIRATFRVLVALQPTARTL